MTILVRRAQNVRELEELLNKIRADVSDPKVIVDREATDTREPQYTVIWEKIQIDPDRALAKKVQAGLIAARSEGLT